MSACTWSALEGVSRCQPPCFGAACRNAPKLGSYLLLARISRRSWSGSAQIQSSFQQMWSNLGQLWSNPARSWPNSNQIWAKALHLVELDGNLIDFSPGAVQRRSGLRRVWSESGHISGRRRPKSRSGGSPKTWPESAPTGVGGDQGTTQKRHSVVYRWSRCTSGKYTHIGKAQYRRSTRRVPVHKWQSIGGVPECYTCAAPAQS